MAQLVVNLKSTNNMKIRIFFRYIITIGIIIGVFLAGYYIGTLDNFAANCYNNNGQPVIKQRNNDTYYVCWKPETTNKIDWVTIDVNILTQGEKLK